jgi:hypothetical protein
MRSTGYAVQYRSSVVWIMLTDYEERAMTLAELLPAIRQLPALEKLRLIRILAEELDTAEDIAPFEPHKIYYLPTPYNMFGAGRALMQAMQQTDSHND